MAGLFAGLGSLGDGGSANYDPAAQPGQYPLTLGGTTFAASECPDDLEFGGQAHMSVVDLIGGGRDIQTFGTHFAPVTWSGRIWGPNVEQRLSDIQQMYVAQSEIQLTYKSEAFFGVIREFKRKRLFVDAVYTITFEISRDANGGTSSAQPQSVDSIVSSLSTQATAQAASVAISDPVGAVPLSQAATNVRGALGTAGPIAQLTGSSLTSVLGITNTSGATAASYLAKLLPSAAQYLPAAQLVTTFGLISKNIASGQNISTIQVVGGSLYDVCATHYGNADLAPLVAAANGVGLILPAGVVTTLKRPPFPVTSFAPLTSRAA